MRTQARPWSCSLRARFLVLPALGILCALGSARAIAGDPDQKTQAAREQFFEQNVRPLLAENCYSCHGDKKQKGGLRLDSLEAILKGGESGPAVVPGKPDESLLVEAINYDGLEMPPNGKLGAGEGRRPHPLGLAGCSLAQPRPRGPCPDQCRPQSARTEAHRRRPRYLVAPTGSPTGRSRPGSTRHPTTGPTGRETRSIASSSRLCSTTV